MNGKRAIVTVNLALAALLCAAVVFGGFNSSVQYQVHGTLALIGVGAFWDPACTNATTEINWGTIGKGDHPVLLYVKNTGTANETLQMTTNSWAPPESATYLSFAWDQEGTIIIPSAVVMSTFTLHVFDNATMGASFTFNAVITGQQ